MSTVSTKPPPNAAFTLFELMVASSLGLLMATVLLALSLFCSRSFAAIANYVSLDQASQLALDKMSREIRQAHKLTAYSPTSLTFDDVDGKVLQFTYDPDSRTLLRISEGQTNALLPGCDSLSFSIFQRTPKEGTFDCYDPASVTDTKLIQVTWKCSRSILGAKVNTESVQSSKITLRNH